MEAKGLIMLHIMLNRFHHGVSLEAVLKGWPQDFVQAVVSQSVETDDPSPAFNSPEEMLKKIHYSWIIEALGKIPQALKSLMVSSLPESESAGLSKALNLPRTSQKFASAIKTYLQQQFVPALNEDKILPREFLPKSIFNALLDLNKKELLMVIDYLGLYDLANELRYVVDKKIIKTIYDSLSPGKQHYLRTCIHQKERLVVPRLHLEKWNGDVQSLEHQLHNRGMLRFGKALSGQNQDLVWHIVHTLDIGRGKILMKYYASEEILRISTVLAQQVINVLNFIKKKS